MLATNLPRNLLYVFMPIVLSAAPGHAQIMEEVIVTAQKRAQSVQDVSM